mgnify:CR=1 FL=1
MVNSDDDSVAFDFDHLDRLVLLNHLALCDHVDTFVVDHGQAAGAQHRATDAGLAKEGFVARFEPIPFFRGFLQKQMPADGRIRHVLDEQPQHEHGEKHRPEKQQDTEIKAFGEVDSGLVSYALRHHFISAMLANGVDVFAVAKLAGHKGVEMILDHYGHLCPNRAGEAIDIVAATIQKQNILQKQNK